MTNICHNIVFVVDNNGAVECGGLIEEAITTENGVLVSDRVCKKCGASVGLCKEILPTQIVLAETVSVPVQLRL